MSEESLKAELDWHIDAIAKQDKEIKQLKAKNREMRKSLQGLSDAVMLHLYYLDNRIGKDKSIPKQVSAALAKCANLLEYQNDSVRYFSLGIDHRKDDKEKAVQKLKQSQKDKQ